MSTESSTQDRITELREDTAAAEKKLAHIEATSAKNSMLASATAARLRALRRELAELEKAERT